jgi:hypothetical protein
VAPVHSAGCVSYDDPTGVSQRTSSGGTVPSSACHWVCGRASRCVLHSMCHGTCCAPRGHLVRHVRSFMLRPAACCMVCATCAPSSGVSVREYFERRGRAACCDVPAISARSGIEPTALHRACNAGAPAGQCSALAQLFQIASSDRECAAGRIRRLDPCNAAAKRRPVRVGYALLYPKALRGLVVCEPHSVGGKAEGFRALPAGSKVIRERSIQLGFV